MSPRQPDFDPRAMESLVGRLFGRGTTFARVAEGVSTPVYRLERGAAVAYLRAAETPGASLAPEASLHYVLSRAGVRLPDVLGFEERAPEIDRSVLVLAEVAGRPLSDGVDRQRGTAVARQAGEQLALVNGMVVTGFGWVSRDGGSAWPLRAEFADHPSFVLHDLDERSAVLADVDRGSRVWIESAIDDEVGSEPPSPCLAHGDFDTTPIFHVDGRLTGLIDFGEIRGAPWTYDLAHFHLREGEYLGYPLLPALLQGYGEVRDLPEDVMEVLRRQAVLITVRELCRWYRRLGPAALTSRVGRHRITRLRALVNSQTGGEPDR